MGVRIQMLIYSVYLCCLFTGIHTLYTQCLESGCQPSDLLHTPLQTVWWVGRPYQRADQGCWGDGDSGECDPYWPAEKWPGSDHTVCRRVYICILLALS